MKKLHDYINKFYSDVNSHVINMGLERVDNVKKLAGINPKFPIIIVGGTNGKGSVCAFLETIYSKAGYSVGCYTSPHLFKFNERIKINLEQLDDKTILKSLDFIQNKKKSIELTYFEITTLAAMNIFIEKEIDIAILEVGLGGRLDAVNIFDPEISIITSLGMDHQEYLGDSIEEIAYEKIGICRSNKNIILNFKDIPSSMLNSLNDLNVKVSKLNFDYSYKLNSKNYNYISQDFSIERLPLPHLNGSNQLMNLTGSLRIIDLLKKRFPVEQDAINKGIRETRIKGRLQVLSTEPYIIADVAHNVDAAINLYNFINTSKHSGKIFAIFSILENKDLKRVLMPFLDIVDEWNISEINDSRSQKIDVIETKLREYKNPVSINKFSSLTRAFENAQKKCNVNDNIIIFGSFLTVSEIMDGVKFNG